MKIRKVALVLPFLLTTPILAVADEAQILEAHFEAVGGLDKLAAIKTVRRTGAARMTGVFGEMKGTIEEVAVVGRKSYSDLDLGVHRETTAWDGFSAWKTTPLEGTVTLSGSDLDTARAAAFLDPLQDLYEQYGPLAYQQGEDAVIRGRDCAALWIVDTEIAFYVDKETHYVLAMRAPVDDPNLGDADVTLHYSDHGERGGVMLPSSMDVDIADGTILLELDYSQIELDVDVDESIFEHP